MSDEMAKYQHALTQIKAKVQKLKAFIKIQRQDPFGSMFQLRYWSLNDADFELALSLTGNERMAIGACHEREINCNKPGWVETGNRALDEAEALITEEEFNDQMTKEHGGRVTYDLYRKMRTAEEEFKKQ